MTRGLERPAGLDRERSRGSLSVGAFVGTLMLLLAYTVLPVAAVQDRAQPTSPADLGPARELARLQKYEEAELLLSELENVHPDDPSLLLLRGEVLLAINNPKKAADVLAHAAEVAPQKLRVHFGLGAALAALDDRAGAVAAFGTEIELNPDPEIRAKARANRSVLYERDQRWSDSAAEMEAILAETPDRPEVFGDLAQIYLKAERPDDALRAVERGAERGLLAAPLFVNVGAHYFNKKAFDLAATAFRRALEAEPDLAQAELDLARALDRLERKDEANSHLRRYLDLRPNAPEASEIRKRLAGSTKATTAKSK